MKTHKKLWLSVLLLLGSVVPLFLLSSQVSAEVSKDIWQKATFQFVDRSTIKAKAGGETFDFIDVDPWDKDVEYVLENGPTSCTNKINGLGAFAVDKLGAYPPVIGADKIHLKYDEQATGCSDIKAVNSIDNADQGARTYFKWIDSGRIESIDSTLAFTKDDDGSFHVTKSEDRCIDRIFVTDQGVKYFELDPEGENIEKFDLVKNLAGTGCKVSGVNFAIYIDGDDRRPRGNLERLAGISVFITDPENKSKPPGTGTPGGTDETQGATGDDEACYSSGWALSWVVCPVISAAQGLANTIYEFVEDQLQFRVEDGNKKDSLGDKETREDVKNVWNNFRILVSALVVILMLAMVIGQAIGSGPFDAYTVKKMLPRLVAGVILIQLSWPIFSWVINFVDDLGRGLADIMYAPFDGADALNLNEILKGFEGYAGGFSWIGIVGGIVAAVVAPFFLLGILLTVLAALFAGFLTLIFRKILIILALIFAPVALIAWMMPNDGLRRYWKLWWDNFIKALIMFPLIIAIIAGGRIFAKIGSGQGGDFVGFFIVLVGFFGPLFILPKTFKWGGTVMTMAGNAMTKAQTATLKKPKEFLGERQKGYSEERTRQSRERYLRNEGFNWRRPWRRPIDLLKSGQADPTLWGRRRETAMRKYRAAGAESEEVDIKAADQEFGLLASQSANHDEFARLVGGAQIGDEVQWDDRFGRRQRRRVTADMKRAGMNGMAKFGTDRTFRELGRILDELNHGGAEEQILAERFLDANVGTLKPKMDYLYRGQSRAPGGSDAMPDTVLDPATGAVVGLTGPIASRVGALTPEAFASMEAPELETILAGLSQVANHHPDAAARAAAEGHLRTIYTHYEEALDNDQIRRSMGPSLNQTMKAHLDGTNIVEINTARTDAGLTTPIEQVGAIMTPAYTAMAARIGADGTAR